MVDTTKLWNRLLTWAPPANTGLETFLPIPLFLPFPTEMILFNAILGISNVCNTVVSYWFIHNQRSIKIKPNHASNLTRKNHRTYHVFIIQFDLILKWKFWKKKIFAGISLKIDYCVVERFSVFLKLASIGQHKWISLKDSRNTIWTNFYLFFAVFCYFFLP